MTTVQPAGNESGEMKEKDEEVEEKSQGRLSKVMEDLEIVTENVLEGRLVQDDGQGDNTNKTKRNSVQEVGSEAEEFLDSEVEEAKRQEGDSHTTHKAGDVFTV